MIWQEHQNSDEESSNPPTIILCDYGPVEPESDDEVSDLEDDEMYIDFQARDHDDDEDIILRGSSYRPNDAAERNRTRLDLPQIQLLTPFIKDTSKAIEVCEVLLQAKKKEHTSFALQCSDRRQLVTKKKSSTQQSLQVRKAVSTVWDVGTLGGLLSGEMGRPGNMARVEGFGSQRMIDDISIFFWREPYLFFFSFSTRKKDMYTPYKAILFF